MSGENFKGFFDWLAKPMEQEDIDAWYLANNIIPEYTELFRDFCISFLNLLTKTYLGDDRDTNNETKVVMSEKQKKEHFLWCWNKTIENFKKENIIINSNGEHKDYFKSFFMDTFYNQKETDIKKSITKFLKDIFDIGITYYKSDLDLLTELYKLIEKNSE